LAPERRLILSFGRRRGRRLRAGRTALVADILPRYALAAPEGAMIEPSSLFAEVKEALWLEIGFGAGEHLAWQAAHHPRVGFIGCEPYLNGVAALTARLDAGAIGNVRIYPDDARPLVAALPDASIGRAFVLFADPWPKTRHHKRRLIQPGFVAALARVMAPGAELRLATDDRPYLLVMLEVMTASPDFAWLARGPADWRTRPEDWPPTRYEAKAKGEGRVCTYLRFKRLAPTALRLGAKLV
jgi:tRNA (guanine-N7-)-methyltransferase